VDWLSTFSCDIPMSEMLIQENKKKEWLSVVNA
jgi:hypothetical protein